MADPPRHPHTGEHTDRQPHAGEHIGRYPDTGEEESAPGRRSRVWRVVLIAVAALIVVLLILSHALGFRGLH